MLATVLCTILGCRYREGGDFTGDADLVRDRERFYRDAAGAGPFLRIASSTASETRVLRWVKIGRDFA
jgi:hypothetical protein